MWFSPKFKTCIDQSVTVKNKTIINKPNHKILKRAKPADAYGRNLLYRNQNRIDGIDPVYL